MAIYKFDNQKLREALHKVLFARDKFRRDALGFCKRVGGTGEALDQLYLKSRPGGGESLSGVLFKKEPFKKMWKKVANNVYYPIIDIPEGLALAREIDSLEWDSSELRRLVKAKDPRVFSMWIKTSDECGVIIEDDEYSPIDGMEKLSKEEYADIINGKV